MSQRETVRSRDAVARYLAGGDSGEYKPIVTHFPTNIVFEELSNYIQSHCLNDHIVMLRINIFREVAIDTNHCLRRLQSHATCQHSP